MCKAFEEDKVFITEKLKFVLGRVTTIFTIFSISHYAEPHCLVGTVADSITEGCWFDPWPSKYSFRGLITVIATGFIPLSPLSVVLTMYMWESSQWLGKSIVWSTG